MNLSPAPDVKSEYFPGPIVVTCAGYTVGSSAAVVIGGGELPAELCVVSLDTIPTNGLSLLQGEAPLGPKINLCATGITLEFGGPEGARIELSPTGITLAFGPPAGASITLDATGVTLKFGPTNQIQLAAEGPTLQGAKIGLQALAALEVQTVELTETASGPVTRTGAATTMM